MTENEMINGWTFEKTIKTTENLMETESNMFKWDVLRHLRDFAENYKDELKQYRAIGTIEEFKDLKEKSNKDFELLLKEVKESYPMFKGAYVELDVFMGDVMRRFTRDRKQS